MHVNVERGDFVTTPGAFTGCDQLSATVGDADGRHLDLFADGGATAWESGFVEGVLECC